MKINCDIFRDLFPSYIRGEITDETKRFVDEHLEECNVCKSILYDMTNDVKEENNNTIERKEIKGLKKINRQMIILKCIILLLVIVIISSLGIVCFRYYKEYKNGMAVYELLNKAYDNTEKFKLSNNFTFSTKSSNIENTIYYKNGKFKQIFLYEHLKGSYLVYGKDGGNVTYSIDYIDYSIPSSMESINISTYNYGAKEYIFGDYASLENFKNLEDLIKLRPIDFGKCSIEEDEYNNIPCYVLKRKYGNFVYECLYFNKENNLLLKDEEFNYKGDIIDFKEYTYSLESVSDDEIKLKEDLLDYEFDNYDEVVKYINEYINN